MEHDEHTEEFHLPDPSAAPIIVAAGMTLVLTGLISPFMLIVGLVVLAVGVGMWALGK